ncbi:glycosyltransferase family 2 protein [Glonium stellatum]|uniref:Glycosyltransferase family 2 protein n=1 Tax=Glonium stellatum TaxID=574774 RepID=A0A8E2JX94_9PEZI|nr:glycosyltransferase family 2 protein [Glonium stellatum]
MTLAHNNSLPGKHILLAGSDAQKRQKFENHRSEALFRVLEYNWIICPIGLTICFFLSYFTISRYLLIRTVIDYSTWWTSDTLICVLLGAPTHLSQIFPFGYALGVCWPINPFEYRKKPKTRAFKSLRLCLVTKGDNAQTVLNTIANWDELRHIDPRICFHVILDNSLPQALVGRIPDFIEILFVPPSFRPPKALYKARALEYARIAQSLGPDDWVLHLDEETTVDPFAIKTCLNFIERGDRHFGMGTIFYNSQGHWRNPFLTVAEISRITADFGRFRLPFKLHARPASGWVHGSFILVNGQVENDIGWDTECLAEDFWFGLHAANKGYKFGWLDAIAREQPPRSIKDICAQRKRWFAGIWSCGEPVACWSYVGCMFYFAGILHSIYILFIREDPLVVPRWVFVWGVLCCTEGLWAAITSTAAQDIDAGDISIWQMIGHVVVSFFFTPFVNFLECTLLVEAILFPPKKFHVVKKV